MAGAAIAILMSLAVAWMVMTVLFQRHLERREIELLDRQSLPLIAGLQVDARGRLSVTTEPSESTQPKTGQPAAGSTNGTDLGATYALARALRDAESASSYQIERLLRLLPITPVR